jgi:hypothetical protein
MRNESNLIISVAYVKVWVENLCVETISMEISRDSKYNLVIWFTDFEEYFIFDIKCYNNDIL